MLFEHASAADAELEAQIADIVKDRFGIDTFAAVRSRAELAAAIDGKPVRRAMGEDKFVHTIFLERPARPAAFAELLADHAGRGPERLAPGTARAPHRFRRRRRAARS